jgi:hypothetical protein
MHGRKSLRIKKIRRREDAVAWEEGKYYQVMVKENRRRKRERVGNIN